MARKKKTLLLELAELRLFIKTLKGDEKALASRTIEALGIGTHEEPKVTGTVYESVRETVAWKELALKLGAKPAQIKRATRITESLVIRCTPKLAS
jgi:hypothetical protein